MVDEATGCFICDKHGRGDDVPGGVLRIPHLHVHLAPRYPGTPPELFGLGAVNIQRSDAVRRGGAAEIDGLCDHLRAAIS